MTKKLHLTFFALLFALTKLTAQTPLTSAPDITVKTIKGDIINLYALLAENKIVAIDFFSVSCGPCQTFAHDFEEAYQAFGANSGNVFFLGVNYNGTNSDVIFFDSVFDITLPSCSGLEGGGNLAFSTFQISAYPTVVVIQPDKTIASQHVWEPTSSNITAAVINAGGLYVSQNENPEQATKKLNIFPQPASGFINLGFVSNPDAVFSTIKIRDLAGRILDVQTFDLVAGYNNVVVRTAELRKGAYVIEVLMGNTSLNEKFVIQ